jgi:hypothetical protein
VYDTGAAKLNNVVQDVTVSIAGFTEHGKYGDNLYQQQQRTAESE